MVCEKCEAKLAKIVTPDPWKSGARNTTEGKLPINRLQKSLIFILLMFLLNLNRRTQNKREQSTHKCQGPL